MDLPFYLNKRVDSTILPGCQEPKIPHGDIVKSICGLRKEVRASQGSPFPS